MIGTVLGSHVDEVYALKLSKLGAEDELLPFNMLGDYRLQCVQAIETRDNYEPKANEKAYGFVAINRCTHPISVSFEFGQGTPSPNCTSYMRSQVTFAASEVGAANWSDLGDALEAFKHSEYVYYGGPLGNHRNATIRETFTPSFRP